MPKKIHSLTHTYPVTSLKIGQHTGRLMASSDTNSLNVWAIGKTTPILKLSSPNSSCIALDWNEEIIVAGNHNGSLKLWDLETEKGGLLLLAICCNTYVKSYTKPNWSQPYYLLRRVPSFR